MGVGIAFTWWSRLNKLSCMFHRLVHHLIRVSLHQLVRHRKRRNNFLQNLHESERLYFQLVDVNLKPRIELALNAVWVCEIIKHSMSYCSLFRMKLPPFEYIFGIIEKFPIEKYPKNKNVPC